MIDYIILNTNIVIQSCYNHVKLDHVKCQYNFDQLFYHGFTINLKRWWEQCYSGEVQYIIATTVVGCILVYVRSS